MNWRNLFFFSKFWSEMSIYDIYKSTDTGSSTQLSFISIQHKVHYICILYVCRTQSPRGLRLSQRQFACWDCGFESLRTCKNWIKNYANTRRRRKKDEEPPLNTKTRDLQRILSDMETWDWPWLGAKCGSGRERSGIHWFLFWDYQRKKGGISKVNTAGFIWKKPQPGTSLGHYATVKKRSVQGPYSDAYKNFRSGPWTYQSKCTKFNFFI